MKKALVNAQLLDWDPTKELFEINSGRIRL